MQVKLAWQLVKNTLGSWSDDNATRLAAALAFYTVLSIAPLLVLAVAVAGWVFGEDAARGQIATQLSSIVGSQAGEGIQSLLQQAHQPEHSMLGSIIGGVVLLVGASGVFGELQSALNAIWRVKPKPGRGVVGAMRDRFFSFSMVMVVAFLLLVSLVLTALLSAVGAFFEDVLPGGENMWQLINGGMSLLVITCLFALIFKVLPDVKISWRLVWPGAAFTALLFTAGKYALGLYLGRASVSSPYGAAGSLVVLVIWVYYAAQIMFLGAEFTRQYARALGVELEPARDAIPAAEDAAPVSVRPPPPAENAPTREAHA
jgi:membrane protein